MHHTSHSFCRSCLNCCPMVVEIADGRVVAATGDPDNQLFGGYSCVKGRRLPDSHYHPDRLLTSRKRIGADRFVDIDVETAMDEIAERLGTLLAKRGPQALAAYSGNNAALHSLTTPFVEAFMRAAGSRMSFTSNTIDKPGFSLARAMHGMWMAPLQGYHAPDVALLVGANPLKSYYGAAAGNPSTWLREQKHRGMDLIVIDPRRSDVAKRADLHLQPRPGHDVAILASLISVIIEEQRCDHTFIDQNARGLDELRRVVSAFQPSRVAAAADVDADALIDIARRFSTPDRGYVVSGVGASFSASSTLVEYLTLVLETLCGHWMREGERVERLPTLLAPPEYRAQAAPPRPAYDLGPPLRVRGLTPTTAGMPTGVLAEEMLLAGDGQVKALISIGGNPVVSWPDQLQTLAALRELELLVQLDITMSPTARQADYAIAVAMPFETPDMTLITDMVIATGKYYGPANAHAQYSSALVEPPAGSQVIDEWTFFYGIAKRLGFDLSIAPMSLVPGAAEPTPVDMTSEPSADELLRLLAGHGRVPFDDVKSAASGGSFPSEDVVVLPKESGWTERLDLANADMMRDLDDLSREHLDVAEASARFPFRLINIRSQDQYNSTMSASVTGKRRTHNPVFLHPDDLVELGLAPGDTVTITSQRASIPSIVAADATLRRGLAAMTFGYGDAPDRDAEHAAIGSSPARLLDWTQFADPYVGMPVIGNVPVRVDRADTSPVP